MIIEKDCQISEDVLFVLRRNNNLYNCENSKKAIKKIIDRLTTFSEETLFKYIIILLLDKNCII